MQKTFGQKIRDYRIQNTEFSLRKLAETVDISPTYLSRIENDKEPPPSEDIIIRIAKTLRMDVDELLSYADKISPDLQKTIRGKPDIYPNFIRTFSNFEENRIENMIELVQFIHSKGLKKTEWNYLEKIIKSLLSDPVKKEDLENIYKVIKTSKKSSL